MIRNRNFLIILSGQLVSQIGDKFHLLALSYWVLETTQSALMMGVVMFASFFPEALIGLFAGAVVDRYDRKGIIIITDLLRGLVVLFLAALFYFDQASVLWIIIAQVILSLNTAFFNPCIPAVLPQIVKEAQLANANSYTQLIRGISTVIGPIIGGIAAASFGYLIVFLVNGVSFLISAGLEAFLQLPHKDKVTTKSDLIADVKEGVLFIRRDQSLMILLAVIALIHFFVGSFQTITPVLASQLTGNGVQILGYLQTAFGTGMIAISFILAMTRSINNKESSLLFGAIFFIGLTSLVLSAMLFYGLSSPVFYIVPFFLYGGFLISAVTGFRTIVQKRIPNQMAGRVFGVAFSLGDISIPLAMLTYGFLLDVFPTATLLMVSGIGLIIIVGLFVKRIQLDNSAQPQQALM